MDRLYIWWHKQGGAGQQGMRRGDRKEEGGNTGGVRDRGVKEGWGDERRREGVREEGCSRERRME